MKGIFYLAITLLLGLCTEYAAAQDYIDNRTQHRFAQTYIGVNTLVVPNSGSLVWQNSNLQFPSAVIPRFTIGGLHFWGKLDFNMNFPLANLGSKATLSDGEIELSTGGDLNFRFYPWQIVYGKIRPYIGISSHITTLRLGNQAVGDRSDIFIKNGLLTGASYSKGRWQIGLESLYTPNSDIDFYSTVDQKNNFELPPLSFGFRLVKFFDVTLREEKPKLLGKTDALEKSLLKEGKLNSLSIAIAPSTTSFLQAPKFSGELASLPRHKININWDLGVGYLMHRPGIHIGVSYRNVTSRSVSYSLEHIIKRKAYSLEAFKFLLDYNGFVPFVGLSISYEQWATGIFVNDVQQGGTNQTKLFSPGIIFGWDILASPLETWTLRTNLRYYPFQKINDIGNESRRIDQFELNFIQLVLYPGRIKTIQRSKQGFYNN